MTIAHPNFGRPLTRMLIRPRVLAGAAVLLIAAGTLSACSPDANRARLEQDMLVTFPNAWAVSQRLQGQDPVKPVVDSLECHSKISPKTDTGPGAWSCSVSYTADGAAKTIELGASVDTFGCYSAFDADHRDATIVDVTTGSTVPDPKVGFDGCFDVHDSSTSTAGH